VTNLTRRTFIAGAMATGAVLSRAEGALLEPTPANHLSPESEIQALITEFSDKFQVPGISIALARAEKLVFAAGYGVADAAATPTPVDTDTLFRIASISKPITAVAIFKLIEAGKLNLSDRVFGPAPSILGDQYGVVSGDVRNITIDHLLTHTCGGWANDGSDPMFQHPRMNHQELITTTLKTHPLQNAPGEKYAYSNFGYCILGRVIEKLTGKPYDKATAELVLKPCGIQDMRICGNTLAERVPHETIYFSEPGKGDPYGMPASRMDSHGGWLATATDLVRFLTRVDGFSVRRDILSPASVREMFTAPAVSPNYAHGWSVNSAHNYWHTGSLPGTTTIAVRTSGHWCWAGLTNTRKPGSGMDLALDQLMWKISAHAAKLPDRDLF
jgi:CubicO group peptidase (beta-lactamase class C family)